MHAELWVVRREVRILRLQVVCASNQSQLMLPQLMSKKLVAEVAGCETAAEITEAEVEVEAERAALVEPAGITCTAGDADVMVVDDMSSFRLSSVSITEHASREKLCNSWRNCAHKAGRHHEATKCANSVIEVSGGKSMMLFHIRSDSESCVEA